MAASTPRNANWRSIQWLRGVAALLVVFHHVREQFSYIKAVFPSEVGAYGVDIFFVISGFIMALIVKPGETRQDFLERRAARVLPLYWAATLLLASVALIAPHLMRSAEVDFSRLIASLAFIPHYAQDGRIKPVLSLGWTLNFEIYFYIVFSFFITATPKFRIFGVGITFASLILLGVITSSSSALFLTYTNPIILEFFAGMVIAYVMPGKSVSKLLGITLVLTGAVLLVSLSTLNNQVERAIIAGIPAALIVAGSVGLEPYWPKSRVGVVLGDASYSLYLSHIFTLGVLRYLWFSVGIPIHGWGLPAFVIAGLGASAGAALLIHRLIEVPMTRRLYQQIRALRMINRIAAS